MNTTNIKSGNTILSINNGNYGGVPFFYDYVNAQTSQVDPSTVHCNNAYMSWYFKRYLLQKAISVFEWTLPNHWAENYFLYTLYTWGFVAIIDTPKFGIIPQNCSLAGYDVQYQPTDIIIANPLLPEIKEYKINQNAVLLKLMPDYGGVMDIVNYYGNMLSLSGESIEMNLINSKLAYVFMSDNKSAAESFKLLFDKINSGNPVTFVDKKLFNEDGSPSWHFFNQNLKDTYISDKLLSDMRKIEAMFDTKIGIPNANTDKKERLITDEVNANNEETETLAELWLKNIQKGIQEANNMFGLNMSVKFKYKKENENAQIVNPRSVELG